uniref:Uncharacterized protein n=1 Tax=viral metagenome TaxID=1070528 RepID=A0A6C0EV10_9ZZZZ
MSFPKKLKDLCTPAMVYFVISIVGLSMVLLQNLGNVNSYHVGSFSCRVPSTILVFVVKLLYILFWTWILNLICKDGHTGISWLLVLLPWILLFVMMGLLILNM